MWEAKKYIRILRLKPNSFTGGCKQRAKCAALSTSVFFPCVTAEELKMGVAWNLQITAFFLEWTEALNSLDKSPLTLFIMCDKST